MHFIKFTKKASEFAHDISTVVGKPQHIQGHLK